ncbi:phage integrase N-terminal domain-containing protein [Ralstonia wenshanensis]|uniref:phage integrase N-terminal domain-containing protein n=1 Tax=Ralstonia wenshanensis TaxID=2842456 RepID=UPI003D9573DC
MNEIFAGNKAGRTPARKNADGTFSKAGHWTKQLSELLEKPENARTVRGERRASDRTQEARSKILFQGFKELKLLGYRFETIHSFRQKHMQVLVNKWVDEGKCATTIQNRLTTFRIFSSWIGKKDLIGSTTDFVKDPDAARRSLATLASKSGSGNGVNIDEKLAQIRAEDERAGLMLLAGRTWGLRRLEMVCIRPHATIEASGVTNILAFTDINVTRDELQAAIATSGTGLPIKKGTNSGRYRVIPLDTPEKLALLEALQSAVRNQHEHIGWPGKSLQASANHLSYLARKFGLTKAKLGVTLDGLRNAANNNAFPHLAEIQSAIRGGNSPVHGEPRGAAQLVAQLLGRSLINITSAYCGTVHSMGAAHKNRVIKELDALQPHIEAMTAALDRHGFINLCMVGSRAMGKRRPQDATVPFEFITFGEKRQPTPGLQAELEAILHARVYVRVMADTAPETSASYLNNMLMVINVAVDDAGAKGPGAIWNLTSDRNDRR